MIENAEYANVFSRNKNGIEAAEEIIKGINKRQPKLVLLFSTIHYKNEFEEILKCFRDKIPDVLLAGGTVAGFMNQEGCFTMGMAALVFYGNITALCSVGKDVKRDPKKAAEECMQETIKKMKKLKLYKNKFIFLFTSGPTMPSFPGIGRKFIIRSGALASIADKMIELSTKNFQQGFGREEEVQKYVSETFKDLYIFSASSSDDNKVKENYQFLIENNKIQILTNSTILTFFSFKNDLDMKVSHGYKPIDNKIMEITSSLFGNKIIKTIDNKPSFDIFKEKLKINVDIPDSQLHRKTWFFPFGFVMGKNKITPAAVGGIVKNSFWFSYGADSNKLCILTASGKNIIDNFLRIFDKSAKFVFGVSCCGNIETLGKEVYALQDKLRKTQTPFFVIFSLGEGFHAPNENPLFYNESNILVSFK